MISSTSNCSNYLNDGIEHDLELGGSLRDPGQVRDGLDMTQLRELGLLEQVQTDDLGLIGQHLHRNRGEHGTGSGTGHTDGYAAERRNNLFVAGQRWRDLVDTRDLGFSGRSWRDKMTAHFIMSPKWEE